MHRIFPIVFCLLGFAAGPASAKTEPGAAETVTLGFDAGDWSGIELSADHVKTGTCFALWKDHPTNKFISSRKIPHDWRGFEEMRFWICNAGKKPLSVMIVLESRTDPKAFSYFGYRLTIDWDGWKEVVIPIAYFEPTRDPAGWQKIDSVTLSVDGWGITPDPAAVLYLSAPELRKSPAKTPSPEEQAGLDKIKRQFCDYQRDARKSSGDAADDEKHVREWMQSLTAEGTWQDVNYTDATRGYWRAVDHITRLNRMCLACTSPESALHGDPALRAAIHAALGHWLKKDYRNPNWWHNEIGVPRELGTILLLMDSELTPQERNAGIRIVSRAVMDSPPHWGRGVLTGQNRLWVAANALIRGLLASDFELVGRARNVIFEEVTVATQSGGETPNFKPSGKPGEIFPSAREGIQPDFSFFQHGPMLQLGNYGLAFAGDVVVWQTVLRDTALAPDQEKAGIIRDYLLTGESTVVWKGSMDINSCGRQIGPHSPASKGGAVLRILAAAKAIDSAHAEEYQTAIDQIGPAAGMIPPLNRYFWRADYMVHRRPGYYVSTRMSSARVLAAELVNGENLQGGYSGDGATYVYLTGREYDDIFPVWDWSRLPGVTSPAISDKNLLKPKNGIITNPSDFVGGVSDGKYGAASLTLDRDGLTARKSWFYFDDEIVCLGAGISCDQDSLPVTTSVNQCLARGDVTVEAGRGPVPPAAGVGNYTDLQWAWHDNVGYVFPEPLSIHLGIQRQEGNWNEVSASGANQSAVSADVFSIWISHGARPRADRYGYVILPGVPRAAIEARARRLDVAILENTPALQAVRHDKLNLIQAVFYEPGKLEYGNGKTISVDQPCILLLDGNNQLTLADPTQRLADITVTLDGKPAKHVLPAGARAGSSFSGVSSNAPGF
jgi:chondroitin AC lyase